MSDLNLKAKEFVPSWIKAKPAAPPAAPSAAAPAPAAPSPAPAAKAPAAKAPTVAPQPTTAARHMNPNAAVFQPAGWPAPSAKPQTPKLQAAPLPPPTQPLSTTNNNTKAPTAHLTEDQKKAIVQKSNLKAAAAVFIPGQRGAHLSKLLMSKPSPLTLTPIVPDGDAEMLLSDLWCLYILCTAVAKEDTFDPAPVFRIDSVATFWKTMNNLPEPTELPAPSTMYLFRDDINPKWEDPKNCKGGLYKLRVDRPKIDSVWLLTAAKTIGESWVKEHRNKVNGVVLKVRERSFYIEIWVTEKVEGLPTDLLNAIEHELDCFNIDYFTHEELREAVVAATAKKQKQNKSKRK